MRTCSTCGQPYQPKTTRQRFCRSSCRDKVLGRRKRARRGTQTYGYAHKKLREQWKPIVDRGEAACSRCFLPIVPGTRWELDHTDDGTAYRGPSHQACNARAGAVKGNTSRSRYTSSAPRIAR